MNTTIINKETVEDMYKQSAGNIRKLRPDMSEEQALQVAKTINVVIADRYYARAKLKHLTGKFNYERQG